MKKLAIRLSLFIIIMVCLDLATGYLMDNIYARTQKGDYGRNNYINSEMQQECLIFGSSRAIHHYDPKMIGEALNMSCYNCGEDGLGIITMYGRYMMIRERYIPKVIIYDVVSDFDLWADDKSKYLGRLRFYDDNEEIKSLIAKIDETERYKGLSQSYKYNTKFIDIISQCYSNSRGTTAEYTYTPLYGEIAYDIDTKPKSVAVKREYVVDELKMQLFESMIKQCKEDGTLLVIAISPWFGAESDEDYRPIIELCDKYDISVLNHITDKDINFKPSLFKDESHLNVKGVEMYDRRICEELKEIACK